MPAAARFGLIGCGSVGSLLDEASPPGRAALTHASAITRSPRAVLVAVCDTDPDRAAACAAARGVGRWYTDATELLQHEGLDAVVLATPPEARLRLVDAAIAAGVRLLWLEKPAARTRAEAEAIMSSATDAGVAVAVNHLRRWAPLAEVLAPAIESIGGLQVVAGTYTKGLLNNGTHLLDLVAGAIGFPSAGRVLRTVKDGRTTDPTVDALLTVPLAEGVVPLYIRGADYRRFSLLEAEFVGAGGRVCVRDSGRVLTTEDVEMDPMFPGYRGLAGPMARTGLLDGMFERAVDQLVDVLEGKADRPRCGMTEAIGIMRTIELLRPGQAPEG